MSASIEDLRLININYELIVLFYILLGNDKIDLEMSLHYFHQFND